MGVKENFKEYLNTGKKSQGQIARAIGYSQSALNQWIHKKYPGDVKKLEKSIILFLRRERSREVMSIKCGYVKTSVSSDVVSALHLCHIDLDMGLIYGRSGIGKTEGVKEYVRMNPDTIFITCKQGWYQRSVLYKLASELNQSPTGSPHLIIDRIIYALEGTDRLVVFDEAEFLTLKSMDTARQVVYDGAGVGLAFVGMPIAFKKMLGKDREEYEQVYNRIGVKFQLGEPQYEDVEIFALENGIKDKKVIEYLYTVIQNPGRSMRTIGKLIPKALRMSKMEGMPVTVELIKEVGLSIIM